MGRFVFGALVGAATMYMLDPESGQERRRKLGAWWRENRGTMRMKQAGQVTTRKMEDLKPAMQKASQTAAERARAVGTKIKSARGQGKEDEGWTPPPATGTEHVEDAQAY